MHEGLKCVVTLSGKGSGCQNTPCRKAEDIYDSEVLGRRVKKSRCSTTYNVRTKTDTGRRDEYSKALERTLVKELCNMAP